MTRFGNDAIQQGQHQTRTKLGDSEDPVMTFPDEEREFLKDAYQKARIILEYGSGGSTLYAARLPGHYVMSVESDWRWAVNLQNKLDTEATSSQVVVYHADIGQTGDWGRPVDATHWHRFHQYATHIWAKPYFRNPDLVLIDGRLRAACFVATFLRIRKPTIVLFDDYVDRKAYHVVEKLAEPVDISGRMAKFMIVPGPRPIWMHDLFMELISDITFATASHFPYLAHEETHYPFSPDLMSS